jgi:tetratricopeptide (TPR) repeat protein
MGRIGLHEQAGEALSAALEATARVHDPQDPELLAMHAELGELLYSNTRAEEAEPHASAAYQGWRRHGLERRKEHLAAANLLGRVYYRQGRYDDSEALLEEALDGRRQLLGDDHPDTIESIWRCAQLQLAQGRLYEAETLLLEALDRAERSKLSGLGPLQFRTTLGNLRLQQGWWKEAEQLWLTAHERARQLLGDDHRETLFVRCKLCDLWQRTGRVEQAETECSQLAQHRSALLGPDNLDTLESRQQLYGIQRDLGRTPQAAVGLQDVTERSWRALGPLHPCTQRGVLQLAAAWDELGCVDQAEAVRRRLVDDVLDAFATFRGEGTFHGCSPVFHNLLLMIDRDGARQGRLLDTLRRTYPHGDPRRSNGTLSLAMALMRARRLEDAEVLARDAVQCSATNPSALSARISTLDGLACVLQELGRLDEALSLFEQAEQLSKTAGNGAPSHWLVCDHAGCLLASGRHAEAARLLRDGALAGEGAMRRIPTTLLRLSILIHERWHVSEPAGGHDAEARKWRDVLERAR